LIFVYCSSVSIRCQWSVDLYKIGNRKHKGRNNTQKIQKPRIHKIENKKQTLSFDGDLRLENWTSQNMCCVTSSTYFLTMNHTTDSCARIFSGRVHTLVDLSTSYVPEPRTQVGIEYTYGQTNLHIQNIPAEKQTTLPWNHIVLSTTAPSSVSSPSISLLRPLCHRVLFSQEIIRRLFKKLFHCFHFLKSASTWNCVRRRVSVYMYIRHHVKIVSAYVCMLARARVCVRSWKCLEGLVEFKCALWTETFWKLHRPNCLLTSSFR
jgi:hypothetical protein